MSNRAAPSRRPRRPAAPVRAEPLEGRTLFTTAALLADLNTTAAPVSGLLPALAVGDTLYCTRTATAASGATSYELWATDGTAAGTRRLDVPGFTAQDVVAFGDQIAFTNGDSQLWVTDGQPGDAHLVRDFNAGATDYDGSDGIALTAVGGRLWVEYADGTAAGGLYVSDGTAAGTVQVQQVAGLVSNGEPGVPIVGVGQDVYLAESTANDDATTLWRSDGTAAGTAQVAAGYPEDLVALPGRAVYQTYTSATGVNQVWTIGDAETTPTLLHSYTLGTDLEFTDGVAVGSTYFFAAPDAANTAGTLPQLWATDGTAAGTRQLTTALTDTVGPTSITAGDGRAFFTATAAAGTAGLWTSDGTAAGTVPVYAPTDGSDVVPLAGRAGGPFYFGTVTDDDFGEPGMEQAWQTDGTAAGTTSLGQFTSGLLAERAYPVAAGVYFATGAAHDGDDVVTGLWADTTTAGPLAAFAPDASELASSNPIDFTTVGSQAFFAADVADTTAGDESSAAAFYRTDGTAAGTVQLAAFNTADAYVSGVYGTAGLAYFTVDSHTTTDTQLWRSDGTVAGTFAVPGVAPQFAAFAPAAGPGNDLYFQVQAAGASTVALWVTDGTAAGTVEVAPLATGGDFDGTPFAGRFYYVADETSGSTSPGLYATDGTAAGTSLVFTLPAADEYAEDMTVVGSRLYFATHVGLWVTDGTAAGTAPVPFSPTGTSSDDTPEGNLTAVGNELYFTYSSEQLWKTDGTAAGTTELYSTPTVDQVTSIMEDFTPLAGRLFFELDGDDATALWSTDGTAGGTAAFTDAAGNAVAVQDPVAVGGTLYFTNTDAAHGRELWATDGTAAGTGLVADVSPGVGSSDISDLTALNGQVLFAADDGTHGSEPWLTASGSAVVSPTPTPTPTPTAPTATLVAPAVVPGAAAVTFAVTYADPAGIDPATLTLPGAVTVTPPGGTVGTAATVVSTDAGTDVTTRTVTYRYAAPGGKLTAADNGTYAINVASVVATTAGLSVPAGPLGTFAVDVPATGPSLATTAAVTGAAVGGGKGVAHVTVRNAGPAAADGTVTVQLLLSTTATADPGTTTPITSVPLAVRLKPGQSKATTVRFTYPAGTTDGTRYVVAAVDADGKLPQVDATAATAASAGLAYRHASVDLSATAAAATGRAGKRASVVLRVHNAGSVTAAGPVSFAVSLSGGSLPAAVALPAVTHAVSVKAGATKAVAVPFTVPAGLAAGTYTVTVTLSPTTTPADADATDKTVAVTFTVV